MVKKLSAAPLVLALLLMTWALSGTTAAHAAAPAAAPIAPRSAVLAPTDTTVSPTAQFCSGDAYVHKTLPSGTTWDMCWRLDNAKGLVLSKVAVQGPNDPAPRLVLDSIALTDMNVPYDVGTTEFNDLIAFGFGQNASVMTEAECPNGEIRSTALTSAYWYGGWSDGSRPTLCIRTIDTGLAYRSSYWTDGSNITAQGTALQLSIETAVGNYEYETNYKFHDNGTIDVAVGATGEISPTVWADQVPATAGNPSSYGWPVGPGQKDYASSHYHNAVWRVDFGIDGTNDQKVQQFDTAWTHKRGAESAILRTDTTPITKEALLNNAPRREWRVYSPGSLNSDGHPRGYKIVFGKDDPYEPNPSLRNALAFTSQKTCEQFAELNVDYQCNGQSVLDYANGENLVDPVAWVNVGFHHIVRDEDQSPMPTHWQGFSLTPSDFWAQSPITPAVRSFMNGRISTSGPSGEVGASTTTTLSMNSTSLTPTQTPVATVKVATTAPRSVGVLTFYDGTTDIYEGSIKDGDNGTATVSLPQLDVGTHQLTVTYEGSSQAQPSTSAPVTVTVTPYASTTTATLAASTVTYGSKGTLNVKVNAAVEPTGFLVVSNGSSIVATQKLPAGAGGKATIVLPAQPRGTATFKVQYQGVGKVGDSTSGTVTLTTK